MKADLKAAQTVASTVLMLAALKAPEKADGTV